MSLTYCDGQLALCSAFIQGWGKTVLWQCELYAVYGFDQNFHDTESTIIPQV